MTSPTAATVEQLLWHLRLIPELRPPVLEALQNKLMRLAIFALVQIAAWPRLKMRPPERIALIRRPHDRPVAQLDLSSSA
jgi:hypothetical protein